VLITVLAALGAAASLATPPTSRAEVVNVTLNIAADPRPNPCSPGDVVNLSGRLHIVYYVRADRQGGFHLSQLVDEKARGISFLTNLSYQGSDTYTHSFYAGAPFPVTDTMTHSILLTSRGAAQNLLMGYDLHTTVNATGIPTATVDNVRLSCTG
jgi:hypothetical protein